MKQIEKIIYVAGVVTDNNSLKKLVNSNMPNIYCHHMTIKFGGLDDIPSYNGIETIFIVERVFFNDSAIAVSGYVNDSLIAKVMNINNQHAHITVCTNQGVAPVYSNTLLEVGDSIEFHDVVKMKVGTFVAFTDGTTGWIF